MHQLATAQATDSLIRLPDVMSRVGLKQSRIYQLVATNEFPAPVRLGIRAVAWRESEVSAWIASRPSARPVAGGEL